MIQLDDHLHIVEVRPALQQHEIRDLEGETGRNVWVDPVRFHHELQSGEPLNFTSP
jgi:hypothetical protein